MLRDVALSHCQNETSHLDYMQGSSAANVPLRRIGSKCDSAFCDTIVVFAIVAEYHTVPPGQRENTSSGVLDDVAAVDFSGKLKMRRLKKSHAQVLWERVQKCRFGPPPPVTKVPTPTPRRTPRVRAPDNSHISYRLHVHLRDESLHTTQRVPCALSRCM